MGIAADKAALIPAGIQAPVTRFNAIYHFKAGITGVVFRGIRHRRLGFLTVQHHVIDEQRASTGGDFYFDNQFCDRFFSGRNIEGELCPAVGAAGVPRGERVGIAVAVCFPLGADHKAFTGYAGVFHPHGQLGGGANIHHASGNATLKQSIVLFFTQSNGDGTITGMGIPADKTALIPAGIQPPAGSLCVAAFLKARIEGIVDRVVLRPRRQRTSQHAGQHHDQQEQS